jgi:D-alanyl-D-alanine carboxypeptidase-like protein
MMPGNALIVSTYPLRAPESVRKPIERIAGDKASVQRLDIAARLGLDTSVPQTALLVGSGSVASAVGIFNYTVLGHGRIAPEASWVADHISTEVVPILGAVRCNKLIFPQLKAALQDIVDRGLADKIHPDEYAGCYYPRFIAGTTQLSNHSFGLALDLNVPGNQRGTVGEMDRFVVQIFEEWGFTWGGHWRYTDPMHFEANRIVRPG